MRRRSSLLRDFLSPPRGLPAFHTRRSEEQAFEFWRDHRYDDLGGKVLRSWQPEQVLALDSWLGQRLADGGEPARVMVEGGGENE